MRGSIRRWACAAAVVVMLAGAGSTAVDASKLNMGYLYFGNHDAFIRQVDATRQSLDLVSPTLFDLTPEGGLKLVSDISRLTAEMKSRNIKVVPFLSNHWDRELGRKALANRESLTTSIAEAVIRYGLDGVNVDIENVTDQDREAYTDLVRLLREKLPKGSELSVAIAANPNEWSKGWQASYDLKKLAEYSDYLMLMSYDESWNGSPKPGPVASLPWVERSVQQVLKHVPPEKILLGIPFYGRYWREEGGIMGAGIWNASAEQLAVFYGITPRYDLTAQSPTFTFTVKAGEEAPLVNARRLEPGTYTVWYENERSIKRKLDLVHQYGLRGTGIWCLSQEAPETWDYYGAWLKGVYFRDSVGHWADQDIRAAARLGWVNGTRSGNFEPEGTLTRAQAAAILARSLSLQMRYDLAGVGVNSESWPVAPSAEPFRDVPERHWGKKEIELARLFGLIQGVAPGVFAPEQAVTREELSAMLYRALGMLQEEGAKGSTAVYADLPVERWSYQAIANMSERGYLTGYPDGSFRPTARIKRAEAASLLIRAQSALEQAAGR